MSNDNWDVYIRVFVEDNYGFKSEDQIPDETMFTRIRVSRPPIIKSLWINKNWISF